MNPESEKLTNFLGGVLSMIFLTNLYALKATPAPIIVEIPTTKAFSAWMFNKPEIGGHFISHRIWHQITPGGGHPTD